MGEAIIVALLSSIIATGSLAPLLPAFSAWTGIPPEFLAAEGELLIPASILLALFVGVVAGTYPAVSLSRYSPAELLHAGARSEGSGPTTTLIQQGLVVFQFTISIAMMTCALLISRQLDYVQTKDLGLNQQQVVILPVSTISAERYSALKSELLKVASIRAVTASFSVPGERIVVDDVRPRGAQETDYGVRMVLADFDFPETYGLAVSEGRTFSKDLIGDTAGAFMINQSAGAAFGWNAPVGKEIEYPTMKKTGPVVGLLKDFNYASLHIGIEPLILFLSVNPAYFKNIGVRISTQNRHETLVVIERMWKSILPGHPFEYYFLDESFRNLYASEEKLRVIVSSFTGVGIVIACFGLLGLASLSVEKRTKEIGIRKVLGASVRQIVGLLSEDFLRLVVLANVVAWPAAWYLMHRWLENFAYRTEITLTVFVVAGCSGFALAALTVSVAAMKTATSNPVNALRHE
jgi:putative ABC transport system permease protein